MCFAPPSLGVPRIQFPPQMCDIKQTWIMEEKFTLHKNSFNGRKKLKCLLISVLINLHTEYLYSFP